MHGLNLPIRRISHDGASSVPPRICSSISFVSRFTASFGSLSEVIKRSRCSCHQKIKGIQYLRSYFNGRIERYKQTASELLAMTTVSVKQDCKYRYVTEHVNTVNSKLGSSLFRVRASEVILATPVFKGATSG